MNREIKFRAWDKERKVMENCISINPFFVSDCDRRTWKHNEVELMQYTGLKDRNGKEIYEGDIVQIPLNIKEYFNCEVKFNDGCFDVIQGNFRDYLKVYIANRCVKVIGNVHENPELLKEAK